MDNLEEFLGKIMEETSAGTVNFRMCSRNDPFLMEHSSSFGDGSEVIVDTESNVEEKNQSEAIQRFHSAKEGFDISFLGEADRLSKYGRSKRIANTKRLGFRRRARKKEVGKPSELRGAQKWFKRKDTRAAQDINDYHND